MFWIKISLLKRLIVTVLLFNGLDFDPEINYSICFLDAIRRPTMPKNNLPVYAKANLPMNPKCPPLNLVLQLIHPHRLEEGEVVAKLQTITAG